MTQPQISHSSRMSTPQPPRTSATEADIFHTMGVSWPPRSLLHGPPGSGKTQLLKWLEIQAPPKKSGGHLLGMGSETPTDSTFIGPGVFHCMATSPCNDVHIIYLMQ